MKNKIVTLDFLTTKGACVEGLAWFENKYGKEEVGLKQLIADLQAEDKLEWINWLLTRLFTQKKCVMYAVYAAELVLPIFEKKFPEDMWPRNAIEAAKAYIANPCEETKQNAKAAAYAAYAAARAASSAAYAAHAAAAYAVYAAAVAAAYAANAAYAAYAANAAAVAAAYAANAAYAVAARAARAARAAHAVYAARAAAYAAYAANAANAARAARAADDRKATMHKITDYGIKLLEEEE